ncbi:MAG: ester cyclase [Thermoanaerobaculia bacterium]
MATDNERIARRWFEEVWNTRREETVDELMLPQAVGHMEGADVRGPGDFKAARRELLTAFPDMRVTVEDTVGDGDKVVVRWSAAGTHEGDARGLTPTNSPVRFRGMTWLSIRHGKIVEGWDAWNQGKLVSELQAGSSPG